MAFQGDSIYWVEVEKVVPNPFQPRREFDQNKLQELADSIRMYGVLQPLTVTRKEVQREDGTFYTEYELIAGERRLRASKLSGAAQVPVIIREGEQSEQEKLELAIIENLQREDLNAVDRALAFKQLSEVFGLSHSQVAEKVGRSREYVSNSIRLLGLPETILDALRQGNVSEGHARTLLMLNDKPEEQDVIFREILLKKMSVREVERIVRKIATDKVRKKSTSDLDTYLIEYEKQFTETLGTRVQIQKTDFGGKLTIDYFSVEDLESMLERMKKEAGITSPVEQTPAQRLTEHTPLESITEPVTHSSAVENQPQPPAQSVSNETVKSHPADEQLNALYKERAAILAQLHAEIPEVPAHDTYNHLTSHEPTMAPVERPVGQSPIQQHLQQPAPDAYRRPEPFAPTRPVAFSPNRLAAEDSYDDLFPVDQSPVHEQNAHPANLPTQQAQQNATPEPEKKSPDTNTPDESNLYSIRNFNV